MNENLKQKARDAFTEKYEFDYFIYARDESWIYERVETLCELIENKEIDGLKNILRDCDNSASIKAFEILTGVKLSARQKDRLAQIDSFCSIG